jgi:hypothetical protein
VAAESLTMDIGRGLLEGVEQLEARRLKTVITRPRSFLGDLTARVYPPFREWQGLDESIEHAILFSV